MHKDVLGSGLLALATLGFFWQILLAGAWMPAGGGDLAALLYPTYRFAAESLQSGLIPLWNPYLWSGAPFAADIQAGLFYPINLIYFWLAPEVTYRGLMGLAAFHVWLAGAGVFIYVRRCLTGGAVLPALLGGLAFMFSDYFIIHFGNLNLIAQAAWLPFIFLFYHRALTERRAGLAVGAGAWLAIAATAGHFQPLLFIILGLVWDGLYHLIVSSPQSWRQTGLTLAILVITLLVGLGLAALALVPAYELTGYTLRADYSYAQASDYSLAPAQLVGLLVPGFFGRDPAAHWGAWDRVEVGYVGVVTLLLVCFAGLAQAAPSRVQGGSFRFVWLAGFSLLLAMGGYTIWHGWLYGLVPGLGEMRGPARFVFVMDFALAALAALGLNALIHGAEDKVRPALQSLVRAAPWVIGALLLFALPLAFYALITSQDKDPIIFLRVSAATNGLVFFVGLLSASLGLFYLRQRGRLRPAFIGALAVGLLFFDLASLGSNVDVGYADPTRNFEHPAIIDFLKSDSSLYRIDTRTDVWHLWQPNTPLLHRIYDVAGLINPLNLADYDRYWNTIPSRSSPLYDFLNAKYVIAAKDVQLDWEKFVPVFDADPALNVYLNQRALPRALVVYQAITAADHQAALVALRSPDFDPASTVVVEGSEALEVVPARAASVSMDAFSLNEIQLRVDTPADAYLVLSEVWYPGWQAAVDGTPAAVLRANYAFRAVRLEPGQHQVRLWFAPRSWAVGLAISGLTLLVLVAWAVWRGTHALA